MNDTICERVRRGPDEQVVAPKLADAVASLETCRQIIPLALVSQLPASYGELCR